MDFFVLSNVEYFLVMSVVTEIKRFLDEDDVYTYFWCHV